MSNWYSKVIYRGIYVIEHHEQELLHQITLMTISGPPLGVDSGGRPESEGSEESRS